MTDPFDSAPLPTPLLPLDREGRVFGKLELSLPSGSIKHRSIPQRLLSLRRDGGLAAGQAVVIHSAGSAAIAAAWAGARAGVRVHAVVPRSAPEGVISLLRWLGADCHPVPSRDAPSFIASLCAKEGACLLDQLADTALPALYAPVADEILTQQPDVQAIVVGIGTGGSITGIARRLREGGARCRVVGVEPEEAQLTRGQPWAPHEIHGLAPPMPRPLFVPELVDEVVPVSSAEAWRWARRLAREHGVLAGPASGATVAAAQVLCARGQRRVVAILGGRLHELLTPERVQQHAGPLVPEPGREPPPAPDRP